MGLGVLDDLKLPHVPGTVLLDDQAAHAENLTGNLKHASGTDANIVLSPQPSGDPNDPLNWPLWKKEVITYILCFGAVLNCATNGPFLNASYFAIAKQLNVTITSVVVISGYNLLAAGASGPIYCALSRRYGKRPVFILSTLLNIIGTAIGESKMTFKYLLVSRIIQGFSTSAFESLIISAVGDMYFVHERGVRVALINFILYSASGLASIICGQVFDRVGWLWLFHLFQIFLVIQFVLMFFFCPETTFLRDHRYDTDTLQDEKLMELAQLEKDVAAQTTVVGEVGARQTFQKKTFVQELALYTGVYSHDNILKYIFGPFIPLLNPAACYAIVAAGLLSTWYVGTAIIASGIFSGPPWNYNVSEVGYLAAGTFIGGMLGSIIMIFSSDWVAKRMTKWNDGIYEPEFRLVFMAPCSVFCGVGMFLYGYVIYIGASGPLCAFVNGVMMVGVVIGLFSTTSYGLDAFREESNEIFIMAMLFKNFMFYGLSYFVNDWVVERGPREVMYVFGGVSLFLCLLAIPFYCFGKRLRSWWTRHDLFEALKMKPTAPAQLMA